MKLNFFNALKGKGLIDLLPAGMKSVILPKVMTYAVFGGGGKVYQRTLLSAQKYTVNWDGVDAAFPECAKLSSPTEKWNCLSETMGPQGTLNPAMWDTFNLFRTKVGEPQRVVRDKLVTTEFVDFIVDQLQTETSEFGDFKFHQCGLGVTAENITDSGIETDTGISPATGTQTETDHDTYKSVATMTMDATEAITEHVVMSQSGAGTCMDRTLFSAINVVSGNQIEFTFEISFTAGG